MRRFGPDHPGHIAFGRLDQHTLAKQHLVKPSTQGQEFNETFLGDLFHHETDFIQVTGQHHARSLRTASFFADDAADLILA